MGNANATFGTGANARTAAVGNYQQVASGIQGQANIINSGYQNQLDAFNSGNAITSAIAGGVGGALTSKFLAADGGEVVGPGGPRDDSIQGSFSDGEYVIPADVVRWKGLEHIEKMITSSKEGIASRTLQTQDGGQTGIVPPPVDIDRGRPRVALPPPAPANPRRVY